MTDCHSMIDAFFKGGDFHSRTCVKILIKMSMNPNIKKEVEEGTLLLEWDKSKG